MSSEFAKDVDMGLSDKNKYLSSKYFYDAKGSVLFQQIMELPEYYLTRAELNIFQTKSLNILSKINAESIDIIELGAGDGVKTIEFLKHLSDAGAKLKYYPLDISEDAINQLVDKISLSLPALIISPLIGDYFNKMPHIPPSHAKKVVLFLGANIGNYRHNKAVSLLKLINDNLDLGDMLLIGIDLKKSPNLVAKAYNDSKGVTKAFNLNLLSRINAELGGNINLLKFDFYSQYNPQTGEIESYLVSLEKQEVYLKATDKTYQFGENELVFTELSKKYSTSEIETLAYESGFDCIAQFRDENNYFADCLFEKT